MTEVKWPVSELDLYGVPLAAANNKDPDIAVTGYCGGCDSLVVSRVGAMSNPVGDVVSPWGQTYKMCGDCAAAHKAAIDRVWEALAARYDQRLYVKVPAAPKAAPPTDGRAEGA